MRPTISLIIPCYNESARIELMFNGMIDFTKQWESDYEIIIVDDGSDDGTNEKIKQHIHFQYFQSQQRITLLTQENKGKGGALKYGVQHAKNDFVLTLDADMATMPSELLIWYAQRKIFTNKEILIGSRELKNSKVDDSLMRHVVGNIFNFIITQTLHLNIKDTQCGFKLYPKQIAKEIFAALQIVGWSHDVELLLRANQLGYAITEMPVTWRAVEGSKIKVLRDGWNMFWELRKIKKILKIKAQEVNI